MPPRESSPFQLLVEGPDDKWSIINLMARHGADWNHDKRLPYVRESGGVDALLETAPVVARSARRLGIVLDADLRPDSRWQQLQSRFANIGLQLPATTQLDGLIINGILPDAQIGIWMMPDNANSGALEDFLAYLVPAADPVWPHARSSTADAKALGAPFGNAAKGTIHAWLAWQEPSGMPFGTAITTKALAHDTPEAIRFVAWFSRLFLT